MQNIVMMLLQSCPMDMLNSCHIIPSELDAIMDMY